MFRRRANVSLTGTPIILDDNKEEPSAYDINAIQVVGKTYYGISAKYKTTVSYKATQRLSGAKFELEAEDYTEKAIRKGLPFENKIQRDLVFLEVGGKYVGWGFIFDSDTALFDVKSGSSYPQDFELPLTTHDIIEEYRSKGLERPMLLDIREILKQRQNKGILNSKYLSSYFGGRNPGFYIDSPEIIYEGIPAKATPIKVLKSSKTQKAEMLEQEGIAIAKKMKDSFSFELDSSAHIVFITPGNRKIYLADILTNSMYYLKTLEPSPENSLKLKAENVNFYLNWEVPINPHTYRKLMSALKVYAVDTITGQRSPIIDLMSDEYGLSLTELKKLKKIGEWFENTIKQPGRDGLKPLPIPQPPIIQPTVKTPILPQPAIEAPTPKTRKRTPILPQPVIEAPTPKTRKRTPIIQAPIPKTRKAPVRSTNPLNAFEESLYVLNADVDFDNIGDNEIYTVIAELKSSTDSMPKTQDLDVWTDLLKLTLKELNNLYDLGDLNPGEAQEVLSYLKPILDNIPMSFSKKAFLRYFR